MCGKCFTHNHYMLMENQLTHWLKLIYNFSTIYIGNVVDMRHYVLACPLVAIMNAWYERNRAFCYRVAFHTHQTVHFQPYHVKCYNYGSHVVVICKMILMYATVLLFYMLIRLATAVSTAEPFKPLSLLYST